MKNKVLLEEIQELIVNEGLGSYIDDIAARVGKRILRGTKDAAKQSRKLLRGTKNYVNDVVNKHLIPTVTPEELSRAIIFDTEKKDKQYLLTLLKTMEEKNPKISLYLAEKWGLDISMFDDDWWDLVNHSPNKVFINILTDIRNKFPAIYNKALKKMSEFENEADIVGSRLPEYVKDTLPKKRNILRKRAAMYGTAARMGGI